MKDDEKLKGTPQQLFSLMDTDPNCKSASSRVRYTCSRFWIQRKITKSSCVHAQGNLHRHVLQSKPMTPCRNWVGSLEEIILASAVHDLSGNLQNPTCEKRCRKLHQLMGRSQHNQQNVEARCDLVRTQDEKAKMKIPRQDVGDIYDNSCLLQEWQSLVTQLSMLSEHATNVHTVRLLEPCFVAHGAQGRVFLHQEGD